MSKILYLSAYPQGSHDDAYLRGRSFVLELKSSHEVLVRAYATKNKLELLTSSPIGSKFADDLTDLEEIEEYCPEIIISEMPLIDAWNEWKLPLLWLENFVRNGGNVFVMGVNRSALQSFESLNPTNTNKGTENEKGLVRDFFQFIDAEPLNFSNPNGYPGLPYMRDQVASEVTESLRLGSQDCISYPEKYVGSSWIWNKLWDGVNYLLLNDAMPLSVQTIQHTCTTLAQISKIDVLVNDLFVLNNYGFVRDGSVATVRQMGNGYIAAVSANLISDQLIDLCPGNSIWAMNLVRLLDDKAKQNMLIRSEQPKSTNANNHAMTNHLELMSSDQLHQMIRGGENATVEFKTSCLGSKESQNEIMDQICAFANTGGGILLVGVSDDGVIIGVDEEIKKIGTKDNYRKQMTNKARNSFTPDIADLFRINFVSLGDKTILQIGIRDAGSAIVYRKTEDGSEHNCFRRTNSGKKLLNALQMESFVKEKNLNKGKSF